jgi:hypothetical protein
MLYASSFWWAIGPVLLVALGGGPARPAPTVQFSKQISVNQFIAMPNTENGPLFQYADGAANLYLLRADSLEYRPVTPAESSTGIYSGGEPKTVPVPPAARAELVALLERALAAAQPTPGRAKGTGWVAKGDGPEKQEVILAMNSPLKAQIEAYLKALID